MPALHILFYNVHGLRTPEAHKMLLTDLHKRRIDRETHFQTEKILTITDRHFWIAYHSGAPNKYSKGVSILISRLVPLTFLDFYRDSEGHVLFIFLLLLLFMLLLHFTLLSRTGDICWRDGRRRGWLQLYSWQILRFLQNLTEIVTGSHKQS